ncbi:MAG: tetratricopeptide repeat protein [Gemmatimonadetes bacterium]|nr:tetratricopeptide repeat protein [Gemmatimonadota bacterium]MXX72539.1 tetratricopeptide repeat protein [Gemmatimonadota bacterium]MYC90213.1 tetratricopeptide repeat protein [Gemmatimonadota bacterium]MYG35917.1 tetratricopeptide repeat protein [Gemmatimonadota bacterium]MYJ17849.1 tetratricopeptide repeat protein [Gemmatimonadota bacterium]
MRRGPVLALSAVAALLAPSVAHAQEALFDEGNRLYQEGDFGGAADRYVAVLEGGYESAALYYNLGNAHFRLGEVARAVLNYERAARLDPADEDVQANLALVNQMLQDRIEPLPRFWMLSVFDWWMALIPRGWLATAAAACYSVLGLAAVLMVLDRPRGWRAALRRAVYAGAVGTVILGGTLLIRETGLGHAEHAVVMATEARVLNAPSEEGGLAVFTLHEGTKVRIDRRTGEWAEIVLADGKVGWLRVALIEVI